MNFNAPEVGFALDAVRQAALMVKKIQAEMVTSALVKDDRSPVTVADYTSQALVARALAHAYPEDPLVGEEDAAALHTHATAETLEQVVAFVRRIAPEASPEGVCAWIDRGAAAPADRFWTLDPIDGTKGFLRGDQYAVALALVVNSEVQLGVLGCPNLGESYRLELDGPGSLVFAVRGQGTWFVPLAGGGNPVQLRVSSVAQSAKARLLRSYESGHTNVDQIDELARILDVQVEPVRLDSQAKYAVLAAGYGELMLRMLSPSKPDYKEKIWDQAAGSLVVQEAGGMVSDLHGRPLDFQTGRTLANNRGILASNGHLHAAVLHALATIAA